MDEKGDYIFPVKENQANLYKNIQALFAPEYPKPGFGKIQTDFLQAQKVNKGHGRIERRTLITSEMLNTYAAWPGLAQVYRLESEFQWWRKGVCYKTSCEVEFGMTSLSRIKATPMKLLEVRRAHWGIETGSHYTAPAVGAGVGGTSPSKKMLLASRLEMAQEYWPISTI